MQSNKLSVIIPFYNRSYHLLQSVQSIFHQTAGNIELILVDDGSTDSSLNLACQQWESLCAQHPGKQSPLLSLRIPHSGMPGLVRNRGVAAASAPLIAFLDSDDLWLPNKLERQLPLHRKFRVSHTRERWLRAEKHSQGFKEVSQKTQEHQREGNIFQDALWKCIMGPSTVIIEKSLFDYCGGFREDLEIAEDYEFWLRVSSQVHVAYVDTALVEKRAGMPGQNQLSERYDYIEPFRVRALEALLGTANILSTRQRQMAWDILKTKTEIILRGARKRGHNTDEFTELLRKCNQSIKGF